MATITAPTTATEPTGDQCIVMRGVGWKGYKAVLRVRGERSYPRMVYLDGDLFLMSPAQPHEWIKGRLGRLVMVVVEELDIDCIPAGSTTFRRRLKKGGVEADESFYLSNSARVRGRTDLNLRRVPPPDLVIEAVNTHGAEESVEVWRRFGVPEVWVCDGDTLQILSLQPDGSYAEVSSSPAFPYLPAVEMLEWVNKPLAESETETTWMKQLRAWVRDVLEPRARGHANDEGGA